MGACDAAKVILYVRSILWDLAFNTSLMMPPPQWRMPKPKATPRTRHMDIRFFALPIHERVDTSMNMADHFSMQLPPTFLHAMSITSLDMSHVLATNHLIAGTLSTALTSTQFESPVPPNNEDIDFSSVEPRRTNKQTSV